MVCKHCNKPIELNKGVWIELLNREDIEKLNQWELMATETLSSVCLTKTLNNLVLGLTDHGNAVHEPTKESKIENMLRDVDEM